MNSVSVDELLDGPEKFTLFWGHERGNWRCFSQWFPCEFTLNNITFNCAEQAMMYCKAQLFHDDEILEKVMETDNPSRQKRLGRKVKGFNNEKWKQVARRAVYINNLAKFTQNPKCLDVLFQAVGTTIVEASPYDPLWGIKLGPNEPNALIREKWQGHNWLGEVLTALMNNILNGRLVAASSLPF